MISNKEGKENIRAVLILEIIGRPPKHLVETLEGLIKQMDEEKGVAVVEKKINEPILMKEQKDFYTTFAEIEVEVEDILYLAMLMFKYMPANVEVISPESINLTNNGFSEILSELARRLHSYDEVARVLGVEKTILENKLRAVLEEKARTVIKENSSKLGQIKQEDSEEEDMEVGEDNKKIKTEKKKTKKK